MRRSLFVLALLLIPLFILLPGINDFAYPLGSSYSDIAISHYPNLIFLRESLADGGGIPFWSNTILSGYPFAANPLSGLWYPPGWLLLLLPLPLGINLLVMLHLLWGGVGVFLLLRKRELDVLPAATGAVTFELLPKVFAHFGAGHITLLFAVAWTPWLLLVEEHRKTTTWHTRLLPALVLGLILLADVRWGLYAGILWLFYSLFKTLSNGFDRRSMMLWIKAAIYQLLVAGLIAAPVLLPLLEYTRLSTRQMLTSAESLILSLPVSALLGFLYPDLAGYAEWVVYPGALALLLSIWGLFHHEFRRKNRFFLILILVTLVAAFGPGLPLIGTIMEYIVQLPLLNLLRVPTRSLFLMGLAFAVLLAEGIHYLIQIENKPAVKSRLVAGPILVGITAFGVLLTAGVFMMTGEVAAEFLWGALALTVFCTLILVKQAGKISQHAWLIILLPLLLLDLGGAAYFQVGFREKNVVLAEGRAAAEYLKQQSGLFRVYSPSYSLPQQTASEHGLQLADGIDPLMLQSYAKFMIDASGVPQEGYSVTLPPLEGEDIHVANRQFTPNAHLLGLLNVRYIATEFPLETDGLQLIKQAGSTLIYENEHALPRAWVQPGTAAIGTEIQPVNAMDIWPNRIEINASGPGLLVLSEILYPGWNVSVNGKQSEITPVLDLLRGVVLSESDNRIVFTFRPISVYLGCVLGVIGMLLVLLSMRRIIFAQ
jgi:hypothetical protein